jgi:hypothetical protein
VPASERLAFPNASSLSSLPFSSVAFATDLMTYTTTPELLKTVAAVATHLANATITTSSQPVPIQTGTGSGLFPGAVLALSVAIGTTAFLI